MEDEIYAGWPLPGPGYDATLLLERCRRRQEQALQDLSCKVRRNVIACVTALCAENPSIGGFRWRAYTPIYNDGLPAVFRAAPCVVPTPRQGPAAAWPRVAEQFRQAFPPAMLRLAFGEEVDVLVDAGGGLVLEALPWNHDREDL